MVFTSFDWDESNSPIVFGSSFFPVEDGQMIMIRRDDMTKPVFLAWLFNKLGDYYLSVSGKDNSNHKWFSKWVKYSSLMEMDKAQVVPGTTFFRDEFISACSHRSVFDCELLLDYDPPEGVPTTSVKVTAIINHRTLEQRGYAPVTHFTGSRGYHTSVIMPFLRGLPVSIRTKTKSELIELYGADTQKAHDKVMIALEGERHWKTGIWKSEVLGI